MGDFKLSTWAKKWLYGLGATLATTAVIAVGDYLQTTQFPVEYAFWGGIITVIVVNIGNAIKHLK